MTKKYLLLGILLSICGFNTALANIQSHESLQKAAFMFLQDETKDIPGAEITLRPFDKRLRLHHCSSSLEAFWPLGNKKLGSTTVGIRCNGEKPWKIYIGAHIHIYKYVWVSNAALQRGQIIEKANIKKEKRDITKLSGRYLLASLPIVGKLMRRNVPANQVLTNIMLESQKLVRRGDRIIIVSQHGAVEVRATGVALNEGSKGDRIRVKNMSSKREFEAYITDKQRVLVPF